MEYAFFFCSSLTMSPTSILNGCIAMLMEVSRSMSITSPKSITAVIVPQIRVVLSRCREPAFGNRHITATATAAPRKRYGIRRPQRHQVRSEYFPTSGWTIIPISGGSTQKKESEWGSAPKVENILEIFADWRAYAICTPKNPKLRFQSPQKLMLGFCFIFL